MGEWKVKSIVDLCLMGRGRVISQFELDNDGDYPVFSSQSTNNGEMGKLNTYDFNGEYVTWTTDGANAGTVFYRNGKFNCTNVCGTLLSKGDIDMQFLAYQFGIRAKKYVSYIGNPKLMNNIVAKIPIYFPVLANEQRRIAAVLTAADEAIAASRSLVEKYAAVKQGLMQNLLVIGELTRLDKVCSYIIGGSTPNTHESKYWGGSNIWITPTDLSVLNSQYISNSERKLTDAGLKRATGKLVPANSIIISCRAPVGYCAVVTEPFSFNQGCKALVCKDVNPLFLYYQLSAAKNHLERFASGTTFLELPKKELERFRIHCPSLPEQQRIAEILTAADERLSAERERLRKLEDIKRGLMDDLLTNRVSTDKLQGGI